MEKTLDAIKIEAAIGKLMAATVKISAETSQINTEPQWMPLVGGATFAGAGLALAKLIA